MIYHYWQPTLGPVVVGPLRCSAPAEEGVLVF